MNPTQTRSRGEKRDITVCAPPDGFANNPQVVRTAREVVLAYGLQEIAKLRAIGTHQHHQPVARLAWSVSLDGGHSWWNTDRPPDVGAVLDCSYGQPIPGGGMVTISFVKPYLTPYAFIQKGQVGVMPYNNHLPCVEALPLLDFGPFRNFYIHSMTRTSDGALLAGGYSIVPGGRITDQYTTTFLRSEDEGRAWRYWSHVPAPEAAFGFSESGLLAGADGRVLCVMRADWDHVPAAERPKEATVGYGWFMFQVQSDDNGATWGEPAQLPLWGHPPYLLRLASGAALMVYGHRRPPYSVRAVLSRDEGRSWDLSTLRTVRLFDPGNYDIGYPQATQLADGTILCAYYGYSSAEVEGMPDAHGNPISLNPCGIFVSLFDEEWLAQGEPTIRP